MYTLALEILDLMYVYYPLSVLDPDLNYRVGNPFGIETQ